MTSVGWPDLELATPCLKPNRIQEALARLVDGSKRLLRPFHVSAATAFVFRRNPE